MRDHRVVAAIPARAGSKRVKDKNLRSIAGFSLVQRAVLGAREADVFDDIVVLTDSSEIAVSAEEVSARVPYLREGDAEDSSQIEDVIKNFIEVENISGDDVIVLLQPTSPLRSGRHIRRAMEIYAESGVECLVSITALNHKAQPERLMQKHNLDDYLVSPVSDRRPLDKLLFNRDGPMILINVAKNWMDCKKFVWPAAALTTCALCSIDIDTEADLLVARLLEESGEKYCDCKI